MALDWRSMLKDKRFQVGAAVAAALGAYVLYQRKKSTGSTATTGTVSTGSTGGTGSTGYVGGFDSTGTDVAQWLGQYGGSLQNQLDQYSKQLTDSLAGLQQMQTAPETPTQTATAPSLLSVSDITNMGDPWKRITWSPVSGATGYQLKFSGNEGSTFTVKDPVADWRYGKSGGQLTVTPVLSGGQLGAPTVLTI